MRVLTFEHMAIHLSAAAFERLPKEVRSLQFEESITEVVPLPIERAKARCRELHVGSPVTLFVRVCGAGAKGAPTLEIPTQFVERIRLERRREFVPARDLMPLSGAFKVRGYE